MKKLKWPLLIIFSVIILLIILKVTGVLGGDKGINVVVEAAVNRDIVETVNASGKIYPETEIKIKADVSGEIVELPVEEGDSVKKGQLLVKINASIYNSAVQQAEASMQQSQSSVANAKEMAAQAKAQLDRAESNYNRNQQLYKDKVISKMEYEQIQTDYLSAKASYEAAQANITGGKFGVNVAQANVSQARENERRTIITAPSSGVISQLLVKNGERVVGTQQMDGSQIMTIADLGRMEIRVDVSETDISKVRIGDTSIIEVDAYRGQKFKGVVSKISVSSVGFNSSPSSLSGSSTDQVTNYTVHIFILPQSYANLLANTGKGKFPFKPGMSAGVEIQTNRAGGIPTVPINAVTTRDKVDSTKNKEKSADFSEPTNQVVFVYDPKTGKVNMRNVKTGIQDNEYIQITEGLKANEQVVVAPYGTIARILKDGMSVKKVSKDDIYKLEEKK